MAAKLSQCIDSSISITFWEDMIKAPGEKRKRLTTNPELEYKDLEVFRRENTNYLNLLLKAHLCKDRTGRCFLVKLKLIVWLIDETIQDGHVGFDQWVEVLRALPLQIDRLALDGYNTSDKYAYDMNEEAKPYTVKWREITNKEIEEWEDQKRQHCFHTG